MLDTQKTIKFFDSVFNFALIIGLGSLVLLLNIFLCILVGALCCRRRSSKIKRSNTLPQSLRLPVGYVSQEGTRHQQETHYQRNQINLEMSSSPSELADSTEVRYVPTATNSVYLEEAPSYCEGRQFNRSLPPSSRAEYSLPQVLPRQQQTMSYVEYNQAYNLPTVSIHNPSDNNDDPKEYAVPLIISNSSKRPSFLEYNHAYNLPVPSSSPVNTTGYNKLMRSDSTGTVPIDNPDAMEIHPDFLHHSHQSSSTQSSQPLTNSYSRLVLPTDYLVPVQNQGSVIIHDYEEILPKEPIPVEQNLAYSTSCHQ